MNKFRKVQNTTRRFVRRFIFAIAGFIVGIGCGYLAYEFVISELDLSEKYEMLILGNAVVFLSLGFAFSDQIRCITCLTLPEFFSSAGKRSIQAMIMILMLSGPVENIGRNSEEVLHLVTCLKDLAVNITMEGRDLVLAPINHVIYMLKAKSETIETDANLNFTELEEIVDPVIQEVEDTDETAELKEKSDNLDESLGITKRSEIVEGDNHIENKDSEAEKIEKEYRRKLEYRCEDIFTRGTEKCYTLFRKKYDDCFVAIGNFFDTKISSLTPQVIIDGVGYLLCWPMKLEFICDLLGMFAVDELCDMHQIVPAGFGQSYLSAKTGVDDFRKKFNVEIDYNGITKFVNLELEELELDSKQAQLIFSRSKAYIQSYISLVKRVLAFSFLLMLFSAMKYHSKYLGRLSFDNTYITKYFLRLDARRELDGKQFLIPLKSYERPHFVLSVFRLKLRGEEIPKFILQILGILLQALIVSVIYGFDWLFTNLLLFVRKHTKDIDISQEGVHEFNFEIQGDGLIAKLLRSIISDGAFNFNHTVNRVYATNPCLPNPIELPNSYIIRTLILFGILLIIGYIGAFSLRLRHCIAHTFYPKRSKERILWLYNETRRRRIGKLIQLKDQVLLNGDELRTKVNFNVILALKLTFPRLCACLGLFKRSQRQCVLCKEDGEVAHCPKCDFSYCASCWEDLDQRCLYCIAEAELHEKMYDDEEDPGETVV